MSQMCLIYACQRGLVICQAASLHPWISYVLLKTPTSLKSTKNKFCMRALHIVQVKATREVILALIGLAVQSEIAFLAHSVPLGKHTLSICNMYNSLLSTILALGSLTLNGTITLRGHRRTTTLCNLHNSPHPLHWGSLMIFPSSPL